MQYEISGSVLAGQITTTTWAGAPSRTWAWSRAIGGAGRGIGGAGQFASWTRAEAAVARATVPPRRSTLRWTCPGRALGEGSGRRSLGLVHAAWRSGGASRVGGRGISMCARCRVSEAGQLASWTKGGSGSGSASHRSKVALGGGSGGPGHGTPPGVQLCGGPAQGAPWAKAAVDRAWARRGLQGGSDPIATSANM